MRGCCRPCGQYESRAEMEITMNSRVDRIYEKMNEGKLVKGFFLTMEDPAVSEMAGWIGYDYVWIDAEHGALGRQEILRHIVAGAGKRLLRHRQSAVSRAFFIKSDFGYGTGRRHFPFYT